MILCDLPYGSTGSNWDSVIDPERLWAQYNRVITGNGVIALFGTEPFCTLMRSHNLKMYKYDWVWHKNTTTGFAHAKNMPLRDYENIMIFSKGAINHPSRTRNRMVYNPQGLIDCTRACNPHKKTVLYHAGTFKNTSYDRYVQTKKGYPRMVLSFNKGAMDHVYHMSAKPVDLLEYLILTYTDDGGTVLDSCMGGGSTCVACVRTGRNFIGMELSQEYYEISRDRIEKEMKIERDRKSQGNIE